jgi:hypothetical protein
LLEELEDIKMRLRKVRNESQRAAGQQDDASSEEEKRSLRSSRRSSGERERELKRGDEGDDKNECNIGE